MKKRQQTPEERARDWETNRPKLEKEMRRMFRSLTNAKKLMADFPGRTPLVTGMVEAALASRLVVDILPGETADAYTKRATDTLISRHVGAAHA